MVSPNSRWLYGISDFSTTEPLQNAQEIIACGLDFIEPGLAKASALSHEDFEAAASRLKKSGIRVQSMNWFLPPELKVVGPDVSHSASRKFLERALQRADHLGATAIVFGSPGSRSIPAAFSAEKSRAQLISFCQLAADLIVEAQYGMKIAVEHVNHTETNHLNSFAQALDLVREVDRPEIGLAADFYHFAMENESSEIMLEAGDLIHAVQLANPDGRCFPRPGVEIPGLDLFFEHLAASGYEGGVSVEATVTRSLKEDCQGAAEFFRTLSLSAS